MSYSIIAKSVGPRCNLSCEYCYYLEKSDLFVDSSSGETPWLMPEDVLDSFVCQMFDSPGSHTVEFVWQGGEPLLAGIPFYEKAIGLQKKYSKGRAYANVIQTNGTLLNDDWGRFMVQNKILAGISIDGPGHLHDAYRKDKQGRGSFKQVMAGLEALKKHGVDYNILATINGKNADHPLETYQFLKEHSQGFIQFVPVVKEDTESSSGVTDWSVTPEQFGEFNVTIYDQWVQNDVGKVFVQLFDATLGNHLGAPPPVCYYAGNCPQAGLLEHNGDVYACDHFVSPEFLRGNIRTSTLHQMLDSQEQHVFRLGKSQSLASECRECPVLFVCKGECPKNRFLPAKDGGCKNYLCAGYKRFFQHSMPSMRHMAQLVIEGRLASEIMECPG